ncbi:tetratricopeptide repeat-containing sensor histidine kinase [Tenacibaculum jejuense]|uniref:histidine kinase n=1 Tax=Tenacibaculum jejuense TaxID=584609 RepID=A0A238UC48_9FLAO|nr:tetratricopeptide repeat-containing sensor histidine kinase [Tenacibaculum jejuense]SNR15990.1 Two-component system sensor histidine kinase [Tenacibaculum jejuense]
MKGFWLNIIFVGLSFVSCTKDHKQNNNYKEFVKKIKTSFELGDELKTKFYLKEYLKTSLKDNNILYIGKAYNRLGLYYYWFNEIDSSYYFYDKAVPFFKKLKDNSRLSKVYSNMAIIESNFNDYTKSNSTSVKALNSLKGVNSKYLSNIYNNLGINLRNQGLYNEAIDYYKKAIKFSNKKKNIIEYKNNIAVAYKFQKKYTKSIKIYEELLKDTIGIPSIKARIIDNLGYTRWLKDSTLNILSSLVLAKKIRIKIKDNNGLIASYAHLSDYFKNINSQKSLDFAYKMLEISNKEKRSNDIVEAYDKIISLEVDSIALATSLKRNKLKDFIYAKKDKAQNKYALIKYESQEFEKKAIQSEKQKQLWIYIGSLSLLTLIAYFFYKRQKTKKEKIIEVYKTETRLAKKIHDELANDVYLAMNKIQSNTTIESTDLLADLDKIYKQTRDISHENSPVITGEKFQEFLQQLFIDFTTDTCKIINKGLSEINVNSLTKEKQIVLYRVVQELLVNMKKHSKANLVVITFDREKDKIKVRYKDNGVGVQLIANKNGLNNMETRIKSIGGTITFDSEKQKGFQAKFQFKK